jgi:hypothetical protein
MINPERDQQSLIESRDHRTYTKLGKREQLHQPRVTIGYSLKDKGLCFTDSLELGLLPQRGRYPNGHHHNEPSFKPSQQRIR